MKQITKLILFVVLVTLSTSLFAQDTVRVMTYNVYIGGMANMQQLGEYIKSHDPDIVLLQELDLYTNRPDAPSQNGRNQITELGYYANMLPVYGATLAHPTGGYYGIGILSKHPISSVKFIQLPRAFKRTERRGLLIAEVLINGKKLTVMDTHLALNEKERKVQMRYIARYSREHIKGKRLLCGDLNSTPEENLVPKIFKTWKEALPIEQPTFSSWQPIYKYDWMLYPKGKPLHIINAQIDTTANLSDHLPGIIDFTF